MLGTRALFLPNRFEPGIFPPNPLLMRPVSRLKSPTTAAVRLLRQAGVGYGCHLYRYIDGGGTAVAARELGVDEHAVIKTLVMEDDERQPLVVLMHGDREVSTKSLARAIGAKTIAPCRADVATRHSGYLIGGTSPFATRRPLPIFMERSVCDLATIFVNGGKRGFLISLATQDLLRLLDPVLIDAAR